jgi:hypothetical protein
MSLGACDRADSSHLYQYDGLGFAASGSLTGRCVAAKTGKNGSTLTLAECGANTQARFTLFISSFSSYSFLFLVFVYVDIVGPR